jgi:predicted ATP-dependent endonuclease of OLD family
MNKKYKLIGLQIEGLRLIKAANLQFKPSGLTEIIGKNNQGKSTVIDAIEILFEGFKQSTDDIISHGEEKAVIIGDLEEFTIKRVITEKTNRLEILTKAGFKPSKPQDFLNTLINKLTFRPQVFLDKKPEEKLKSVMDILKIDFTTENSQITTKENERVLIGRDIKNLGEKTEPPRVDAVDTADLLRQKQDIQSHNDKENLKQADIDYFTALITSIENSINVVNNSDIKRPLRKSGLIAIKKTISDIVGSLPSPEVKSSADIDLQITNASTTNQQAQTYKDYQVWGTSKASKQTEYNTLTIEIKELREKKIQKLKDTEMPVKGLLIKEVTEGVYGLFYNDIYCENWSKSLGWKIALAICAAMQPDLKAIFLDNGETLDEDTRKELDKWAIANDIQVVLTIVQKIPDELLEGSFYIQEGRIFNTDGDCVPEEPTVIDEPIQPEVKQEKPKIDTQTLF